MKILHVEDNAVDADLTRRDLLRSAPEVLVENVATLAAARTRLATPDHFDIVLVDLLKSSAGPRDNPLCYGQ